MPDTTTKKSKWGLGGMLHKDRPTDSTYGSEGGTSSARDSYNAPSLTGSDNSAPTSTYTNSAGQTVTTTTTTTTTTTSGAGGQSETSGPHTSNMLNRLDPRVNSGSEETQTQEINQRREPPKSAPGIPSKSVRREPSPQPPPQQQQQSSRSSIPAILTGRSNRDRSPGYGDSPSSPSGRQNFSYPRQHGAPEPQGGQQTSTLQGLKTAAAGIHVGTTPFSLYLSAFRNLYSISLAC